ncbi:MAG: hypothetical protein FWF44_02470 [Defluviitaleaceae bacterium]|nr:hypothetical protein [Defluviitaleaceae bacterium]
MPKKNEIVEAKPLKPITTQDPRAIVASTPNSKYTIENKDNKKLIEKFQTPEGKTSRVTYAPNNNTVTTISDKKKTK